MLPWGKLDHQPKYHDLHHEYFNGNYGNVGFLDWLHGTTFKESFVEKAEERKRNLRIAAAKKRAQVGDESPETTCSDGTRSDRMIASAGN